MKFDGSTKQNKWAADILQNAVLTDEQIDNLLRWAGPTKHAQGIMNAQLIIDHRSSLADYADALGRFYKLSSEEKHAVAEEAVDMFGKFWSS